MHPSTEEKEGESDVMLGLPSLRVWTRHAPMPLLEQITSLAASIQFISHLALLLARAITALQLFATASFTVCARLETAAFTSFPF